MGILLLALILLAVMQGIIFNQNRRIMVDQAKIDAAVTRLTTAVDKVVAAQGTQTPDGTVNALLDNVDAQSSKLEAVVPAPVA